MNTLLDANRAITQDLPAGCIRKKHWREAGWAVFKAGDSGGSADIRAATELLVQAVDREGWMQRDVQSFRLQRLAEYLSAIEQPLRTCMAAPIVRGPPTLTVIVGSRVQVAREESTRSIERLRRAS